MPAKRSVSSPPPEIRNIPFGMGVGELAQIKTPDKTVVIRLGSINGNGDRAFFQLITPGEVTMVNGEFEVLTDLVKAANKK